MVSRTRIAEFEAAIEEARAEHAGATNAKAKRAAYSRLTALKRQNREYQVSTDWAVDDDAIDD